MEARKTGRGGHGRMTLQSLAKRQRSADACSHEQRLAADFRINRPVGPGCAAIRMRRTYNRACGHFHRRLFLAAAGSFPNPDGSRSRPLAAPAPLAPASCLRACAAFLSPRAHEPNPAGRDPSDLAGDMLQYVLLPAGSIPNRSGAAQELDLLTLASPPCGNASVHEPAHADIHRHAQRQERKQHRRSAVTH